jgi:prephenate dehydrogenase
MWRDILMANRDEVLAQASSFRQALAEIEHAMAAGDAQTVMAKIAAPSALRGAWRMGGGTGVGSVSGMDGDSDPAAADAAA